MNLSSTTHPSPSWSCLVLHKSLVKPWSHMNNTIRMSFHTRDIIDRTNTLIKRTAGAERTVLDTSKTLPFGSALDTPFLFRPPGLERSRQRLAQLQTTLKNDSSIDIIDYVTGIGNGSREIIHVIDAIASNHRRNCSRTFSNKKTCFLTKNRAPENA